MMKPLSSSEIQTLSESIEAAWQLPVAELESDVEKLFFQFLSGLRSGVIRAASPHEGHWRAHPWVKRGILLGMRLGKLQESDALHEAQPFIEKHTMPLRPLSSSERVRLAPGGSAIRDGAYIAPGVVIMPPSYVNIGAYVDEDSMIDSHVLVGSCAQIGKRVHLSAAVQIGGVLEPAQATPVIVEDDAFIGGNCGLYEGVIVSARAVLAAGVTLTASSKIYDIVKQCVYQAAPGAPLIVPSGAVVVPGSRALKGDFAMAHGLAAYAPLIIKYRDAQTDAKTALEASLRPL